MLPNLSTYSLFDAAVSTGLIVPEVLKFTGAVPGAIFLSVGLFPYGRNCLMYVDDGGHARVEAGRSLGMVPPWLMNSWFRISSIFGLLEGSLFKILVIRSLAASEMGTFSGKEYAFILIRLYVVLTSEVSKGGFPIIKV
jgi:hypothetical protein